MSFLPTCQHGWPVKEDLAAGARWGKGSLHLVLSLPPQVPWSSWTLWRDVQESANSTGGWVYLGCCCGENESEVAQSCLTLCDSTDCSPPGSSIHGILQARILEWVAISFSRGSSQPRDWTQVSCNALTSEPPGKPLTDLISQGLLARLPSQDSAGPSHWHRCLLQEAEKEVIWKWNILLKTLDSDTWKFPIILCNWVYKHIVF